MVLVERSHPNSLKRVPKSRYNVLSARYIFLRYCFLFVACLELYFVLKCRPLDISQNLDTLLGLWRIIWQCAKFYAHLIGPLGPK